MVNHFRTLILNREALPEKVLYGQYISTGFRPIPLTPEEVDFRRAILGNNPSRSEEEFAATLITRLVMDTRETQKIANAIDDRLSFDLREPILDDLGKNVLKIPKIDQIWAKILSTKGFRRIFQSDGPNSEVMAGLFRSLSGLKRPDRKIAFAVTAYSLGLQERLPDPEGAYPAQESPTTIFKSF